MDVALSVKQPWAALLIAGRKTIEVRRWPTVRRGRVLLHAAKTPDERAEGWNLVRSLPSDLRCLADLRGGIMGSLTLLECRTYRSPESFQADQALHHNSPDWFRPPVMFGFRFADPMPLAFQPYPGQVRFFTVERASERSESLVASSHVVDLSPSQSGPRLLVSVRSPDEVEPAVDGGADLIDIKEPTQGSLGRSDEATLSAIVDSVAGRRPISAALGELRQAVGRSFPSVVPQLAYLKAGLSGYRSRELAWRIEWSAVAERLRSVNPECRLVAVAYADWERANAPPPENVADLACREPAGAFLLDTWRKDGTTLLDWLNSERIARLVRQCRAAGVPVALAGSLGRTQIQTLLPIAPDWFAVRGAVCGEGQRLSSVDATRVRELVELLRAGTDQAPTLHS